MSKHTLKWEVRGNSVYTADKFLNGENVGSELVCHGIKNKDVGALIASATALLLERDALKTALEGIMDAG